MNMRLAASPAELGPIAREILERHPEVRVFALTGPMGAGKTTLVQAFCEALGIPGNQVQSPTFGLVNPYVRPGGEAVYHFDLYRLKTEEELLDLGFETYLDSGAYCFIEWPELALPYVPNDYLSISLDIEGTTRVIQWHHGI